MLQIHVCVRIQKNRESQLTASLPEIGLVYPVCFFKVFVQINLPTRGQMILQGHYASK